ncbi:MAG: flagellar hook-length control protein FliK [Sulfuricurvum sp.]|nr:flagellar hook-length control protein FliK [Sulfuricurvum sp.]
MIIHSKETKGNTSLIDLLGGGGKGEDTRNSVFSKLLSSLGMPSKIGEKGTANASANEFKALIDPKNGIVRSAEAPKANTVKNAGLGELQTLLKGMGEEGAEHLISAELTRSLSNDQLRNLVAQAKEYLKKEITAKSPEYQKAPENLPKSLAGLIQMAQKLGLEPEKITFASIQSEPETLPTPELLSKPLLETKAVAQLAAAGPVEETSPIETLTQLISELKNKEKKEAKSPNPLKGDETARSEEVKPSEQPLKTLLQGIEKRETAQSTLSVDTPKNDTPKNDAASAATTKTDSLITLLQGESQGGNDAPTHKNGISGVELDAPKTAAAPKADSLEVKAKEAQQSMRHFAADLKEAVENYKPPFTRLSMKLNPEKLGEVEVTLVQRGNNVHVNIQSNNAGSVAFLAHNAAELKAQLAHQGITNATMNFMGGGDSHNPQEHQQRHNSREAYRAYESFEDLELNDEQLSALEIIIPHYA